MIVLQSTPNTLNELFKGVYTEPDLSAATSFKFIFYALLLLIIFRIFKFFLPVIFRNINKKRVIKRYFPIIELISWCIYFIWSIHLFSKNNTTMLFLPITLLSIIMLIISWYAFRDILAGIVMKTDRSCKINEVVRINDITAKIIAFRYRNLQLETLSGETIFIPYTKVYNHIMVKEHPAELIVSHSFQMNIPVKIFHDNTLDEVKQYILSMPWASINKLPQIHILEEKEDFVTLKATIFALEKDFLFHIEQRVRKQYAL